MSRIRTVVVVLLVVCAVVAGAAPVVAQPRRAARPVPVHLALGDSVATGVGASDPATGGYVPLLTDVLREQSTCGRSERVPCRRLELVNLARSGATTTTLIQEQLPQALALLAARNGDRVPVDDVEVITLDIGGNDVFSLAATCAAGVTPECATAIVERLTTVAVNLNLILASLRTVAGPDTEIIVMTYYNPLPACQLAPLTALGEVVLEGGGALAEGLNDIIRATAARYDATVAETYGRLGVDDLVGGFDCLHPDDSGHAVIADAFAEAAADGGVSSPPRGWTRRLRRAPRSG